MILGFKRRFVPYVLAGSKTHTIRAMRKRRPFRVGDICDCYTDARQKSMLLLGRWPCVKVETIRISRQAVIEIDGTLLDSDELEALARRDGFPGGFADMMKFWEGRLPFYGQVIHWDFDRPAQRKPKGGKLPQCADRKRNRV